MEEVDILIPPQFEKSGVVKTLEEAWNDEDWIGTFNLWILQDLPTPAIVYQVRSPNSNWAPGKLDVSAGGHYSAGEEIKDGLREVREELGKNYNFDQLIKLGRKIHVSPDTLGRERHNLVDIFLIRDNSDISTYKLEEKEVYGICTCPIDKLIKVHTENFIFKVPLLTSTGKVVEIEVNSDSFPYNWDNYHFKITLLADRFLKGEKYLMY